MLFGKTIIFRLIVSLLFPDEQASFNMIILEEDEPHSKFDHVAGSTLRLPDRATIATRSSATLPDYETSEALQHQAAVSKRHFSRVDSRFWRAALYAFVVYIVISIIIAVPLVVTVSTHLPCNHAPLIHILLSYGNRKQNMWSNSHLHQFHGACRPIVRRCWWWALLLWMLRQIAILGFP